MIDPTALRSLVAVERLGSVGAAATALDYTPSAVSQQIKRLEAATGVQLLERQGRGVLLTEAGRTLTDSARDLLARMEQIESRLHGVSGERVGTVRLAAFATGYRGLVVAALARLGREAPLVVLRPDEIDPWDAVEAVATGTHDVALVHNWEPLPLPIPDHLEVRDLGRDVADLLVHRDHRLAGCRSAGVRDVADEAWVSVAPGSICHQWLQKMFFDIGRAPLLTHLSQEFATHVASSPRARPWPSCRASAAACCRSPSWPCRWSPRVRAFGQRGVAADDGRPPGAGGRGRGDRRRGGTGAATLR